jgi:diaminohydroxyphosphoribosylaminopyrimidine deaminase / 5-amino-6-(5-phosphoribosylamino)uracil reductase
VDVDRRDDDRYMDEAFALAEEGRGRTHPNPLVGAVLVKGGRVVGRGWHEGPGRPHAEAMALGEAGPAARDATLYCTLEPCSHHGRTPPCADALVRAGIARAVVALQDPNPLVDGDGMARLQAAGVAVDTGAGRWTARARSQNAAFLKAVRTGLPLVTYKAAMSLDGKVAAAGGDARWISSQESRRTVHAMRAAADAVMVGAGTVRRDDPELTVRLAPGSDPVRVVVSASGELPQRAKVLTTAGETPTLVLATRFAPGAREALEAAGVEALEMGDEGLRRGLALLVERGLLEVLCEGGPGLAGALLEAGLVDRFVVFVAPLVVGRGAPDLVAVPAVESIASALRLGEVRWESIGGDLVVRADVGARPDAGDAGSESAGLAAITAATEGGS